jgi:hypothetical protein
MIFAILKVTDENSRIRILKSEVWIRRRSGSVPTCHGSPNTMVSNKEEKRLHNIELITLLVYLYLK